MKLRKKIALVATATMLGGLAGAVPVHAEAITGGGSTFMSNFIDVCRSLYANNTTVNPGKDTISYSGVGSGTGRTNFANGTFQFGGSESAYTSGAPSNFVYVPLIGGPIAVAYRLDGVTDQVHLSAATIAKIFSGAIKVWNDPAIAADNTAVTVPAKKTQTVSGVKVTVAATGTNAVITTTMSAAAIKANKGKTVLLKRTTAKGASANVGLLKFSRTQANTVKHVRGTSYSVVVDGATIATVSLEATTSGKTLTLPATPIKVAYRSGSSGTTNAFLNYLNKSAPTVWSNVTNDDFTKSIPTTLPTDGTFQAASGNDGVSNYVKDNNGAITYAELSFVLERAGAGVKAAAVKNAGGAWVNPTTTSASEALSYADVAADGLVTLNYTNTSTTVYPIVAVAYGLASTKASTTNSNIRNFFNYLLGTCGPKSAEAIGYSPLAGDIYAKAVALAARIGSGT
jgi:ABC-type phosphate transport system substrate-binding protein